MKFVAPVLRVRGDVVHARARRRPAQREPPVVHRPVGLIRAAADDRRADRRGASGGRRREPQLNELARPQRPAGEDAERARRRMRACELVVALARDIALGHVLVQRPVAVAVGEADVRVDRRAVALEVPGMERALTEEDDLERRQPFPRDPHELVVLEPLAGGDGDLEPAVDLVADRALARERGRGDRDRRSDRDRHREEGRALALRNSGPRPVTGEGRRRRMNSGASRTAAARTTAHQAGYTATGWTAASSCIPAR